MEAVEEDIGSPEARTTLVARTIVEDDRAAALVVVGTVAAEALEAAADVVAVEAGPGKQSCGRAGR